MTEKTTTPVLEWRAEFARTVQGRSGTMAMDIYLLRRNNPNVMLTFSVPHGETELPRLLAKAMNAYAGYEPTIDRSILKVFYGPWRVNDAGQHELVLTPVNVKEFQNILLKSLADNRVYEHDLKVARENYDKLQRSYMVLEQQVLRYSLSGGVPGGELEAHPDLFEETGGKGQRRFDVV